MAAWAACRRLPKLIMPKLGALWLLRARDLDPKGFNPSAFTGRSSDWASEWGRPWGVLFQWKGVRINSIKASHALNEISSR